MRSLVEGLTVIIDWQPRIRENVANKKTLAGGKGVG